MGGSCSQEGYQCDQNGTCQLPGGTRGVKVYGDAYDRWVKTRPVWNQFGHHVTNFALSGGYWDVPVQETPSWTLFNNYRQNVQGGALFPVPNLQVELTASTVCPSEVRLVAEIRNVGSAGAPAFIPVRFYRTDSGASDPPQLLDGETTSDDLLPGESERLSVVVPFDPNVETMSFEVTVDEDEGTEECEEGDNVASAESAECPGVR